jgi:poly(3-hydroxybutyrate) depolymerase
MRKNKVSIAILLCCIFLNVQGQDFQTLNYLKNGTDSLDLNFFRPAKTTTKSPLVIFVHGGGFSGGSRNAGTDFGTYLAKNGFACASISYTLYMKDKDFGCNGILTEKVKAIRYGATDVWAATNYFIQHANELNIDTSRIFIAGSSAGAESVLHAAYWNRNQMSLFKTGLSPTFRYAGIVAGAGALMDLNLITAQNAIPTMLFHGDADKTVPYATAAHRYCPCNATGWLMFFGSKSIYDYMLNMGGSVQLITFKDGNHDYNSYYIRKDTQVVVEFLNKVMKGKKIKRHIRNN